MSLSIASLIGFISWVYKTFLIFRIVLNEVSGKRSTENHIQNQTL